MNIYSDDRFAEAFRAAYFEDQNVESILFKLGDQVWKLPAHQAKPITVQPFQSAFIDFYEPYESVEVPESSITRKVGYLPKASHGMVSAAQWVEQGLDQLYEAAPTILWNSFQSWDEFVKYVQQNRSNLWADSRRRRRKLEKDEGSLTFVFDDRRPEVMAAGMRWKSAQYQKTGCIDHFAYKQHVRLFKELADRKLLLVSSLSAGDKLMAVHLGILAHGRLYWWIPAYDEAYVKYSPGRLLLESILEESFQQGHSEFDFLIGGESYKWHYATHTRLIAEMGSPPLSVRLSWATQVIKETSKSIVRRSLQPFPGLLNSLKNIRSMAKNRLKEKQLSDAISTTLNPPIDQTSG